MQSCTWGPPRRGMQVWKPPPLPSEPDRCFVVEAESFGCHYKESRTTVQLREQLHKATRVSVNWEPSSRKFTGTGFLDLPREIRDLIYGEIHGELKREGLRWIATAPRARLTNASAKWMERVVSSTPYRKDDPVARPAVFADCALMRTCRQLHSEFAPVLYSSPLQLSGLGGGLNEIPLSPLYVGLVRIVFTANTCLNEADCDETWRETLEMATGLSMIFPNLDVMRLGWFVTSYSEDPVTLTQKKPWAWDATVRAAEKSIKRVQRQTGTALVIPHNLEVVQLEGTHDNGHGWPNQFDEVESMPTPVADAIYKLRSTHATRMILRPRKS